MTHNTFQHVQEQNTDTVRESAQHSDNRAAATMLEEVSQSLKSTGGTPAPRLGVNEQLIVGDNEWPSANDIFNANTIKELFPEGSRMDIANTIDELSDIGEGRLHDLAGDDRAFTPSEVDRLLAGGKLRDQERPAFNDLRRSFDHLDERYPLERVTMAEQRVSIWGLGEKMAQQYWPETTMIRGMDTNENCGE